MGSRITRTVFKEERSRPLDRGRNEQIQTLTLVFLGFVSLLACFLHGYLYRPYQPLPLHLLLFLPLLPPRSPILPALLLFITIIATWALGLSMALLKGALLLATLYLSTATHSMVISQVVGGPLFLYLCYSSFELGLGLSTFAHGGEGEEGMLVKVLFSLMALMALYLVSMGIRFLGRQPRFKAHSLHPPDSLHLILGAALIILGPAILHQESLTLKAQLASVAVVIALMIVRKRVEMKYLSIGIVLGLVIGAAVMDMVTEADPTFTFSIQLSRNVGITLALIEGAELAFGRKLVAEDERKKSDWMSGLFFAGCYLSTLSRTVLFLPTIIFPLLQLTSIGAYILLMVINLRNRQQVE